MSNRDADVAKQFVGGTMYQAFLGLLDYYRWHSPIDGVNMKAIVLQGIHYTVLPDVGAQPGDPGLNPSDPHRALIRSQAWITIAAACALIFIQVDNPDIGIMRFIGIGVAEVDIGGGWAEWKRGEELGMFHFGGLAHADLWSSGEGDVRR